MLERKHIKFVEIHGLFTEISLALGFTQEDIDDYSSNLAQLVALWEKQEFIEIYVDNKDRLFGRAKDSSLAIGASPYYIGLYHARLSYQDNDPLIVLTFDYEDNPETTTVSIRFMIDHDTLFGTKEEKFIQQRMKDIRKRIDNFIQKGNK
ncbi:hypothetical protein BKK51_05110 [Rodentibacter trehalosifermentans]|uniref:Uncharacterized protein n=1 Tax=Rodentibacter trehalosifermentans TaxID=1908263 RepID=A0A1V3IU41_9PAST|nr:hypothetical protein [Rodentibacter trehalosifermentans]OOF45783.1 hypothetical protein BKK51_05110 [Rodentibacter trehalosifermentans]OOF47960.1 hypothetical protein BKK52_07340 [Rodentibacter trehalosifermentans]